MKRVTALSRTDVFTCRADTAPRLNSTASLRRPEHVVVHRSHKAQFHLTLLSPRFRQTEKIITGQTAEQMSPAPGQRSGGGALASTPDESTSAEEVHPRRRGALPLSTQRAANERGMSFVGKVCDKRLRGQLEANNRSWSGCSD